MIWQHLSLPDGPHHELQDLSTSTGRTDTSAGVGWWLVWASEIASISFTYFAGP